jgi:uncharacterized protein involved in response to NO
MISDASKTKSSESNLLGLLVAGFYILFTLLPDSSTQVLSWSWVAVWQIGLLCPVLWLLSLVWQQRHLPSLGNGLDWLAGLFAVNLIISTVLAEFPNQARWNSWAALCFLAALYALRLWLRSPQRRDQLLTWQGYLSLAFIAISLLLWTSQTLLPELSKLQDFRRLGVNLPFDFSVLELRNWAPIGHQNYVAGYLLLTLPLLIGLGILRSDRWRWFWIAGAGFGLVDLYTTSSRGGWLGLAVMLILGFGILLGQSAIPRKWLGLAGVGGLLALVLLVLANNRLRTLVTAILSGQAAGGELGFRIITTTAGWEIGRDHPIVGAGLGSVPLLYQKYRPFWAGREAEWVYQLHSTPVQIWAELGAIGIASLVGAIGLLTYLSIRWLQKNAKAAEEETWRERFFFWSIATGLLGYSVASLTDYQLDVVGISGTIVLYLAVLAFTFQPDVEPAQYGLSLSDRQTSGFVLVSVGILLAAILWLLPIHRAWMLSSQGFAALSQLTNTPDPQQRQARLATFEQNLSWAGELAPWEAYYPYQLGWNLGDLGLKVPTDQQTELLAGSLDWLKEGTEAAPYQEFGYTNSAWLLLNRDANAATQGFARAAQLIPAKRTLFLGLGLSLLKQGKTDLAVKAVALEFLRDPLLITSPIWQSPELRSLYTQALKQVEEKYTALLQRYSTPSKLNTYFHQYRGGLRWWLGNLSDAHADWDTYGTRLSQLVLQLADGKAVQVNTQSPVISPGALAIVAWQEKNQRSSWLQQAWIRATRTVPDPALLQQFVDSMNKSANFDQWLKQNAPSRSYRRDRVGFGVLSRHIDGPAPSDFLVIVDNLVMTNFFNELFFPWEYFKELDLALQEERNTLLDNIKPVNHEQ